MTKESRKRVVLEPELEVMAGGLSPSERRRLAAEFRAKAATWLRWSRQLTVSARALELRPVPAPRLRFVAAAKAREN